MSYHTYVQFELQAYDDLDVLLQKPIFPELIQYDLTPDSIVNSYLNMFSMPEQYQSHLLEINDAMSGKGFDNAAKAIKNLL